MNCIEFGDRWNDFLDARPSGLDGPDRALESHASACERCRKVSSGYHALRQALPTLRPLPAPSAASIERLYALTVPARALANPPGCRRHPWASRWASRATAAAAFALACLGGGWWPSGEAVGPLPPEGPARVGPPRPLGLALAEATEATIDLAREASAPASRIGRELFELGRASTGVPALGPGRLADAWSAVEPGPAAPGVFGAVGERVGAGVKPLSGSARHAFSFLLGPPDEPGRAPEPPSKRDSL